MSLLIKFNEISSLLTIRYPKIEIQKNCLAPMIDNSKDCSKNKIGTKIPIIRKANKKLNSNFNIFVNLFLFSSTEKKAIKWIRVVPISIENSKILESKKPKYFV